MLDNITGSIISVQVTGQSAQLNMNRCFFISRMRPSTALYVTKGGSADVRECLFLDFSSTVVVADRGSKATLHACRLFAQSSFDRLLNVSDGAEVLATHNILQQDVKGFGPAEVYLNNCKAVLLENDIETHAGIEVIESDVLLSQNRIRTSRRGRWGQALQIEGSSDRTHVVVADNVVHTSGSYGLYVHVAAACVFRVSGNQIEHVPVPSAAGRNVPIWLPNDFVPIHFANEVI
mmetsp:Transcript_25475/g.44011  ORF Transcript_25475/g.44011 Transcript_25475/m.44011 type:complete len:234 (+) Transcript_25475:674-1375(+)